MENALLSHGRSRRESMSLTNAGIVRSRRDWAALATVTSLSTASAGVPIRDGAGVPTDVAPAPEVDDDFRWWEDGKASADRASLY